jgi:hypothetical protein
MGGICVVTIGETKRGQVKLTNKIKIKGKKKNVQHI